MHDEDPPAGTKLLPGHGYRSPFVTKWPDGEPRIVFEAPAATSRFGEVEAWSLDTVPLNGGEHEVLATNVEQGLSFDDKHHMFLRHHASQATVTGRTTAVLRRIDMTTGQSEDIPDTVDLIVDPLSGRFLYQKLTSAMAASGEGPEMHFNDGAGTDVVIGKATGALTVISGELWSIMGESRTLTHYAAPGAPPEEYLSNVESFWPRWTPSGSLAAVLTTRSPSTGERRLMDMDFATRALADLPATGPTSVIGYTSDGSHFMYMEQAESSGLLHSYDLNALEDSTLVVLAGVDIVRTIVRPVTGEVLYADGNGSLFFVDPAVPGRLSPLYVTVRREVFSDDGKRLFATVAGLASQITVLDADELLAGRISGFSLVPADMKVPRFVPIDNGNQVVFWGHYGDNVADLYLVDVVKNAPLKMIAPQVDVLHTNLVTLVGMVRSSPQDGLSDLVSLDLATGAEKLFARSVSDFTLYCDGCDSLAAGASLAYIVNARTPSERDGIWITKL